jgi:DNA-binding NarL/FixJ family response regulator
MKILHVRGRDRYPDVFDISFHDDYPDVEYKTAGRSLTDAVHAATSGDVGLILVDIDDSYVGVQFLAEFYSTHNIAWHAIPVALLVDKDDQELVDAKLLPPRTGLLILRRPLPRADVLGILERHFGPSRRAEIAGGLRLLYVDDRPDAAFMEIVQTQFPELNVSVRMTVQDGWKFLSDNDVAVLVADCNMLDESGADLVKMVRERDSYASIRTRRNVPVLVWSQHESEEDLVEHGFHFDGSWDPIHFCRHDLSQISPLIARYTGLSPAFSSPSKNP